MSTSRSETCRRLLSEASKGGQSRGKRLLLNCLKWSSSLYFDNDDNNEDKDNDNDEDTCGTKLCRVLWGFAGLLRELAEPTAGLHSAKCIYVYTENILQTFFVLSLYMSEFVLCWHRETLSLALNEHKWTLSIFFPVIGSDYWQLIEFVLCANSSHVCIFIKGIDVH